MNFPRAAAGWSLVALAFTAIPEIAHGDGITTWDCGEASSAHVIWRAMVGTRSGSLASDGRYVLVGTHSKPHRLESAPKDALKFPVKLTSEIPDHGVLMCLDADTGRFLWLNRHRRLGSRDQDLPGSPLTSVPFLDGERAFYVSNRGELVCVDLYGFSDDEDDGPHRDHDQSFGSPDVVWTLDMPSELGVFVRAGGDGLTRTPSPIVAGDLVYCLTGNGSDFGLGTAGVPAPKAPSFIAVHKKTGKVAWSSHRPGEGIMFLQASSPVSLGHPGSSSVAFPGGDGLIHLYSAQSGQFLSSVDCNSSTADPWRVQDGRWIRGSRLFFESRPVTQGNSFYLGMSHELEAASSLKSAPLIAVTAGGREKTTLSVSWRFAPETHFGTMRPVAVDRDSVYALLHPSTLFVIDRKTGEESNRWSFPDPSNRVDGSPLVLSGDRLYVPLDEYIYVFSTREDLRCLGRYDLGDYSAGAHRRCVVSGERLFVAAGGMAWCLDLSP